MSEEVRAIIYKRLQSAAEHIAWRKNNYVRELLGLPPKSKKDWIRDEKQRTD